jgi:hypothetical protein
MKNPLELRLVTIVENVRCELSFVVLFGYHKPILTSLDECTQCVKGISVLWCVILADKAN